MQMRFYLYFQKDILKNFKKKHVKKNKKKSY